MAAAAAAAEFAAAHGDDFDAGLAQQRVGVGVAVVGDDHAGLERDDVVAVVPLLALRLPGVAAGLDDAQFLQAQRIAHHVEQMAFVEMDFDAALAVGARAVAADLVHHLAEGGDQVAVAEAEHRVQVHRGAALRHQAADDARRGALLDQLVGQLVDRLARGALAHADQHHALADRHDVAALDRGCAESLVGVAPPDAEVGALEARVELVDRALQQRLRLARRPEHRVAGHALVDPA